MSAEHIRTALNQRLALLSPALPVAAEGFDFKAVTGAAFQRVLMLYAETRNEVFGCDRWTEAGVYQVSVYYPWNTGHASAQQRAEAVRQHFPRGLSLVHSGVSVLIPRTPWKAPALQVDGWYVVPVSIAYRAEMSP